MTFYVNMTWNHFVRLAGMLALVAGCSSAAGEKIQNLSVSGDRLREAFNETSESARLILVFSPT